MIKACIFIETTTDSIYKTATDIIENLKSIQSDIILKVNNIFIECPQNITKEEIIHKYCKELRWRQD